MTAALLFVLLAAAALLASGTAARWPRNPRRPRRTARGPRWPGRPPSGQSAEVVMIRVVRQLAALLAAGRSGPALWQDAAAALAAESAGSTVPGAAASDRGSPAVAPHLQVIRAARQAAALGLPSGDAIRMAARLSSQRRSGAAILGPADLVAWRELAACFDVSAASGAPLAAVLIRFAARLETEMDAAALRETALAGPRATVRLLGWLPLIGLVLGVAMGVDPLGVLLGGPVGWAALGAGLVLTLVGWWWSQRLIAAAAQNRAPT